MPPPHAHQQQQHHLHQYHYDHPPLGNNNPHQKKNVYTKLQEKFRALSTWQKAAWGLVGVLCMVSVVLLFFFEKQLFAAIAPAVNYIRNSNVGMVIMASILCVTCIFPMIGYGVTAMVCGFIYGIPKGFIPAFVGDIIGASLGFWIYRFGFHKYIERKVRDIEELQELSQAVSHDGFKILLLIRFSSFPFSVINAYFGAMSDLAYWKFILATILSTPRLFLSLYIGNNISNLADPNMSAQDNSLKWATNCVGIVIALAVGYYIYVLTNRRIKKINASHNAQAVAGATGSGVGGVGPDNMPLNNLHWSESSSPPPPLLQHQGSFGYPLSTSGPAPLQYHHPQQQLSPAYPTNQYSYDQHSQYHPYPLQQQISQSSLYGQQQQQQHPPPIVYSQPPSQPPHY